MTRAKRAERAEFEGFCRKMEAAVGEPAEQAYWRMVRKLTVAAIDAANAERGGALNDGQVAVTLALAVGAALMYAVTSKGREGQHLEAARRLAPWVMKAMQDSAANLEKIERGEDVRAQS